MKPKSVLSRTIDRSVLRDHGNAECVDRVWERLERNVSLHPAPKATRPQRWHLLVAAVAAGFAAGYVVHSAITDRPIDAPIVQPEPDADDGSRAMFAASDEARVYALPGGGFIRLEPGSIVDTVAQGQSGLTLRLVLGEAMLSTDSETHGQRTTRVALQVGRAEVATAAGSMRVKLEGDSADLEVLYGTASLTSPDEEVKHRVLRPGRQRVRVRALTASTEPTAIAPSRLFRPPSDEPVEGVALVEEEPAPSESLPALQARPAWMEACDRGDYERAAQLIAQEPGGASTALANVTSAGLLACIGTGHEIAGNPDAAIATHERTLRESSDKQYRAAAAAYLARLYRQKGELDMASHYQNVFQEESKGALLSPEGLCNKIQAAHKVDDRQEVARLSRLYRQQFPDGDCIDTIAKVEAELQAKGEPEPLPPTDPIDDTGEGGGDDEPE
jgi:hypothetical protein